MRTLKFVVKGQRLRKDPSCSFNNITMGSENYLKIHFTFDSLWVGMTKVVKFITDSTSEYIAISDASYDDGSSDWLSPTDGNDEGFMIPSEIVNSKKFGVQVIGTNGYTKLITNTNFVMQEEV